VPVVRFNGRLHYPAYHTAWSEFWTIYLLSHHITPLCCSLFIFYACLQCLFPYKQCWYKREFMAKKYRRPL